MAMTIVYEKLLALDIPAVAHDYGAKDCMLYALGLGLGQDPLNEDDLAFVYEKNLKALPTFALVQGYSAYWLRNPQSGVNWTKVVHGEQGLKLHKPVAPQGSVIGATRIVEVVDKGEGKGALVFSERKVTDKASGELLATLTQTTFCRADGGFGGPKRDTPAPHPIPERAPDMVCDLPTRPEMALIYRLSGDVNPLHADPEFAKAAGFPRPILHGLATFGVAGHALLKAVCGYDPARLTAMAGRFSAPVFPGETIRTEIWQDKNDSGSVLSFRARVVERDVVAINNGRAEVVG
jgi:acyl dehydratase